MRIRYTEPALTEEAEALDYIRERSPRGAQRVSDAIARALDRLLLWPFSGQETDDPGVRRIFATPYPYVILYEPTETDIVIHRVRHTSRDPEAP